MSNFSAKVVGDAVVVTTAGPLQAGGTAEELRAIIDGLRRCGVRRLVLDCERIEPIDAAGVGALVYAWSSAYRVQGHFVLLNPKARLQQVLQVCRLSGLFTMAGSEAEALKRDPSMRPDAARKDMRVECLSPAG